MTLGLRVDSVEEETESKVVIGEVGKEVVVAGTCLEQFVQTGWRELKKAQKTDGRVSYSLPR